MLIKHFLQIKLWQLSYMHLPSDRVLATKRGYKTFLANKILTVVPYLVNDESPLSKQNLTISCFHIVRKTKGIHLHGISRKIRPWCNFSSFAAIFNPFPSRHTTLKQRCFDVNATSWRQFEADTTWFWRHMSAEFILIDFPCILVHVQ